MATPKEEKYRVIQNFVEKLNREYDRRYNSRPRDSAQVINSLITGIVDLFSQIE